MLWPDSEEDNARNSSRHALWRIQKAIELHELAAPYLLTDDLAVSFNAGADHWLDVTQLTRHGDTLKDLADSVSVYKGELLPSFYQDWVWLRTRAPEEFQIKGESPEHARVGFSKVLSNGPQCSKVLLYHRDIQPFLDDGRA